jgi:SAM-dependent methyltransferase
MATQSKSDKVETRSAVLREAAVRKVLPHIRGSGRLAFKAIPALVDAYVERVETAFQSLGKPCDEQERTQLRAALEKHLKEGYDKSPYSWVHVEYQTDAPPAGSLSWVVKTRFVTLEQEFADWVEVKGEKQLFGEHADCKVMDVAASMGAPADVSVLDIGAGTGRNSLALAEAGYRVTVIEPNEKLLAVLRREHDERKLPVTAIRGDILDGSLQVPSGHRLAVLSEVVSHFETPLQIREMLRRLAEVMPADARVLMSCFLSHPSYTPDRLAREVSRAWGCSVFTRKELEAAMAGLSWEQLSDESVYEYEKSRTPRASWPPAPWYENWTQGRDVFRLESGKAPVEMRWVLLRHT